MEIGVSDIRGLGVGDWVMIKDNATLTHGREI